MEPYNEPFDVEILLVGGVVVTTTIEEHGDLDAVLKHLKDIRTGWILLGDVIVYSQNIVTIQPVYDDPEEGKD